MKYPLLGMAGLSAAALLALAGPASAQPRSADGSLHCAELTSNPDPKADAELKTAIVDPGIDPGSADVIKVAIRRLREENVEPSTIVDRAVAAYCPLVDRNAALDLDRKREAVSRFAGAISTLVYDPAARRGDDIVLTVPVDLALSRQIDTSANEAHLTRQAWLVAAIKAHLAGKR